MHILDLRPNVRSQEILSSWEPPNQRVHVSKDNDGPCSDFPHSQHSQTYFGTHGGKTNTLIKQMFVIAQPT